MPRNHLIYSLIFLLLSNPTWAGTLDDLEDDATKPVKRSSSSQNSSRYSNGEDDSSLDSFFAELLLPSKP